MGINLLKGWAKTYGKAGLMMRGGFAAENVAYRNATHQYEGGEPTDMLKDAGKTFIGDVYQYYNIGTKLANGEEVGAEEIANAAATPLSMVGLNIQANKLSEQQIPENLRNFSKEVNNKIGGLFKRNIVSSTAVEALKLIGELRGKNAMTICKILKNKDIPKLKVVEGEKSGLKVVTMEPRLQYVLILRKFVLLQKDMQMKSHMYIKKLSQQQKSQMVIIVQETQQLMMIQGIKVQ